MKSRLVSTRGLAYVLVSALLTLNTERAALARKTDGDITDSSSKPKKQADGKVMSAENFSKYLDKLPQDKLEAIISSRAISLAGRDFSMSIKDRALITNKVLLDQVPSSELNSRLNSIYRRTLEEQLDTAKTIYRDPSKPASGPIEIGSTPQDFQQLGAGVAAIIDSRLVEAESNSVSSIIRGSSYRAKYRLCNDEPFLGQFVSASCTAFLVSKTHMLTAAHCLSGFNSHDDIRLVFGFQYDKTSVSKLTIPNSDIYSVKKVHFSPMYAPGMQAANNIPPDEDWAILEIDREVARHPILALGDGNVSVGRVLFSIGYPSGLPQKVAFGVVKSTEYKPRSMPPAPALVAENNTNIPVELSAKFVATLDTFKGNSGSPVFDQQSRKIEGILVGGGPDYGYDDFRECYVSFVCTFGDGCAGEQVLRISKVIPVLNMLISSPAQKVLPAGPPATPQTGVSAGRS